MFNNLTSRATFYDVTGYLIPGVLFVGIGWATCCLYGGNKILNYTSTAIDKLGGVVTALVLLAVGYVCGHLLNALSSAIYEKSLLKGLFEKSKDWRGRLSRNGKSREARISSRAKLVFGVELHDLQNIDIRIRAEETMPQSFVTGFCFLSFYGMCRTLSFLAVLAVPLMAKLGWDNCHCMCQYAWGCKLGTSLLFIAVMLAIAIVFAFQYLRFATYYYDYLGSTLLFMAKDEKDCLYGDEAPLAKGSIPQRPA